MSLVGAMWLLLVYVQSLERLLALFTVAFAAVLLLLREARVFVLPRELCSASLAQQTELLGCRQALLPAFAPLAR